MSPERAAERVASWARLYTRGVPASIARRRIEEIEADLHDQIAHERSGGVGDRRIALAVLSRMVRGLPADASWRRRHAEASGAYRSALRVLVGTGLILAVPLVAMQFTGEVVWTALDFAAAGALLAATGLTFQAVARRTVLTTYRVAAALALGAAFILVWGMGAVGIVGVEGDRADLMYLGVLAVGLLGAGLSRLRPGGMARTLLAMALAQALVTAIALLAGKHQSPVSSVYELLGLNAFFIALFLGSALLFRRAAQGVPSARCGSPPGT